MTRKLNSIRAANSVLLLCAVTAIRLSAQTITTIHNFTGSDGANPSGLIQGTSGDLLGTTSGGGANCSPIGCGTVFQITTSGTLATLYSFCVQRGCPDGEVPLAGLLEVTSGNYFGTTESGGTGNGTIFKIKPGGEPKTFRNFDGVDGSFPSVALIQADNGNFYGTTPSGGKNGVGTVFQLTLAGTLTTLYNFCSQSGCVDGTNPVASLIQAWDGNFYGTTQDGGANCQPGGCGTVFKITADGVLTILHSFCSQSGCADGANPYSGLIQASNGDLYGTTYGGGVNCDPNGCGTVFRIDSTGALTTLHKFCTQMGCPDGQYPRANLVQATDGNLYGTTYGGGAANAGTIFKITPNGSLATLYNFCPVCGDGEGPQAALVQDTNGNFYGTTALGGLIDGTVFSLSMGLGPFVKTHPASGKVGEVVDILGTDLTGATSVSFNGTQATFDVAQASEITTTVPTGATNGTVQVVTPKGTLTSNVTFHVLQ